jgi:hypothetical protein
MRRIVSDLKAYILCRFAHKSGIYNSWMKDCPYECVVVEEYLPDWRVPDDAGIVITHMHYRWEEIHALRRVYESGTVPVLILADGILEYRNTWEHPELADGSIFQPVMGHKLACIGRGQVRTIESWGNVGKCELVGLPRLDSVVRETTADPEKRPFRLLIATASTPAFNDEQRLAVIESLTHIKDRLEKNPRANGRLIAVTWRLTDGLEQDIGVPVDGDPDDRPSLSDVIDEVDAVITTPSTLYLESLLKHRPTAILDFHNSPLYVPTAWTINAPKHFNWILRELESPPPAKLLFQESILNDNLECRTPAKPRMLELIKTMVESGRAARETDRPIEMPARILEDSQRGFARVAAGFDLRSLYPENTVFGDDDVVRLQIELSQAVSRLGTLPLELNEKNRFLDHALEMLDHLRVRNATMHANIRALRERLGIEEDRDKLQARREAAKRKELPEVNQSTNRTDRHQR